MRLHLFRDINENLNLFHVIEMWYTASALNFRSCHEMRYISLQKTDGRKFVSSVSQRVTDICIHFSCIFWIFKRSASTYVMKGVGGKFRERYRFINTTRPYAIIWSSDVYLESFTAIILFPLERGGSTYCDDNVGSFPWEQRQCTYTCPFVERDVVCLTNRVWPYVRQTACAAINWFKYWSSF